MRQCGEPQLFEHEQTNLETLTGEDLISTVSDKRCYSNTVFFSVPGYHLPPGKG